jgi:hypothetical protein
MSGRLISKAESWERVYEAFKNINFAAFDYDTIKSSMIDYIKLYFPETFNDYIESSEFIAILELFAYLGELLAYRIDLTSHENFLPTAQRKDSVLRLAKLISYTASRSIPARSMVKLTSVRTTEVVYDSQGRNLANKKIVWNDNTNSDWKEQFLLVLNRILKQNFGTVAPNDRVQVQDVLFELYSLNNIPVTNGVLPYSVSVSGQGIPMELVPSSLNVDSPFEKRPEINSSFTILYGSDGLGDSSNTTGFFIFTKQGTLKYKDYTFDGITPNQMIEIGDTDINDTDLWVNNVDPNNGYQIVTIPSVKSTMRDGEWVPVDVSHSQNIIFNTNTIRNKYEVETLTGDNVRIIFGDGEFANVPKGLFHVWYRTSTNTDLVIPQSAITNISSSLDYQDISGNNQSFAFTFSATTTIQNAAPTEDIEHIRRMAPSVYYTQDRMVNGRDYNTYMLQDSSILKMLSVNRTFAGDSKYTAWNDPSETYDNVRIFGDDMAIYFKQLNNTLPAISADVTSLTLVNNYIEPLLSNTDLFINRSLTGNTDAARTRFTYNERTAIVNMLDQTIQWPVYLKYDVTTTPAAWVPVVFTSQAAADADNWLILINQTSGGVWNITYKGTRIIAESPTTRFWFTTKGRVVNYDSKNPGNDLIVLLKANPNKNYSGLQSTNTNFIILNQESYDAGLPDQGLPNIHQLSIINDDLNGDGSPDFGTDNIPLYDISNPTIDVSPVPISTIVVPISFIKGRGDVAVVGIDVADWIEGDTTTSIGEVTNKITILTNSTDAASVSISVKEYVYFTRLTANDAWSITDNSDNTMLSFAADTNNSNFKRENGRNGLNFMWLHKSTNMNLIDPAASNINDMFIITRGYYITIRQWLAGLLPSEPAAPSPLDLRTSYASLLDNKMISDTVILHSGTFKYMFGSHAIPELRGTIKVIRSANTTSTDNQIKLKIIEVINSYFDISLWEFGETFYFTELAAAIHATLPTEIDTVVLVPINAQNFFGDMFQVNSREDELFLPSITVNDIEIVTSLNKLNIKQGSYTV